MIIVTGGAGFVGSNLIHALNREGIDDILVVDNLERAAKHLNLNRLRFFDYVDKRDFFEHAATLGPVETIFHQGACSSTTEIDGRYVMQNNYEFSRRLLHFAEERKARLVYASSAAVYGSGKDGFREERAAECPLNVYGFSKLAFDNYVRRRLAQSPIPMVGLRYFNVYGPNETHKGRMASVAHHLHGQLVRGETMKLFEGSAAFSRDFVHVDDVVEVNLFFARRATRGVFNCGTGEARSFVDVARALQRLHGGGEIEHVPFPDDLKGKYQRFTEASLESLRTAGYDRPFLSLEDGMARYHEVLRSSEGIRP